MSKRMRGSALTAIVIVVVTLLLLLVGELHCCCCAKSPPAAASTPKSQAVPAAAHSQAPTISPPRRRRHNARQQQAAPPPPAPRKQDDHHPVQPQQPSVAEAEAVCGRAIDSNNNTSTSSIDDGGRCSTLLVFGDSTVDPGNNNHLLTKAKANFLPYGVSFLDAYGRSPTPTGRFSNGRLPTDMLAEKLGIARSIPGFFDPTLKLSQLINGVSFASAGSGYDHATAKRLNVVSFSTQIKQLWRYKLLMRKLMGPTRAERLVNRATFVVSAGTNDILFNYLDSNRSGYNTMPEYDSYLMQRLANYTQVMMMLGGRRFLFAGLPPIGCLPIARTLLGAGEDRCDDNLNEVAASFNSKLLDLSNSINCNHQQDARSAYIDTYNIIREATNNPSNFGLTEVWRGCCGSGMIEVGQTCRGRTTCTDPTKYLYWDAVHPTETTNQLITNAMLASIQQLYS
uniref:Uncharacterized protein n=1 Tax=Leersia perrieri TaxID=77586 RepID=A0A0D9WKR9_9ORYZ